MISGDKYMINNLDTMIILQKKLNSIHHTIVINTDRVERIDSTDYNKSCNCEMRLDGGEM